MLFSNTVKTIRENKTLEQISDAQDKIKKVSSKIANVGTQKLPEPETWDWTHSYAKFQSYEDIDELQQTKVMEEEKLAALSAKFDNLGHYHSHDKEREMFEKPEEEKMKICEQYRITIAYYEYCFPSSNEDQQRLDNLRHRCLCNLSKCYINMGNYRQALQAAETVLKEGKLRDSVWLKALYRRAIAYRYLDEYDLALSDLKLALDNAPGDVKIIEEIDRVKRLNDTYRKRNSSFAKLGIQIEDGKKVDREYFGEEIRRVHSQLVHMPLEPVPTSAIREWNKTLLELKSHKL